MSGEHDPWGGSGTVVAARGVWRTFEAGAASVPALRGADLDVRRGEFVALVGPSGCGKSTLLNIVAGLERPDDGRVVVAGHDLGGRSEAELARIRRRHVGIVFQFFNLLDTVTALGNVALAARTAGLGRRPAEARATELLDLLGLLDRASSPPAALSGGQRQRLAIARALANEPTLLLADEPTGALDSAGVDEVLELFALLHGRGQTIIVVTHDDSVAAAAGRVVPMRDGRVEARTAGAR
ncbi:MAG: ABC transporter ATP-binding protein [Ilumatobacteraceae bacterium]